MNTVSKPASKLLISEDKALEKFDLSSLVSTSSSAVLAEPKNAQVSSNSSSPYSASGCNDSKKLSPQSEAEIVATTDSSEGNITGESNTNIVSTISGKTNSPSANLSIQFPNETYQINEIQLKQNIKIYSDNMISTSGKCNKQPISATTMGGPGSLLVSSASSPSKNIANIKCDQFPTVSSLNESGKSQTLLDESSSSNTNGSGSLSLDGSAKPEVGCSTTSISASTSMIRQNTNSGKSCPNKGSVPSPNNSAEPSNSSTISTNLPKVLDTGATDILPDVNQPEKNVNKKKTNLSSLVTVKEEEKSGIMHGPSPKNFMCPTSALTLLSSVKEESDNMNINTKKEEDNLSPEMSPAGFGSIPNLCGTSSVEIRSCTPVVLDEKSKTKSANSNNGVNTGSSEKIASVLGTLNNNSPKVCEEDVLSVPRPASSVVTTSADSLTTGGTHSTANLLNNNNIASGSTGNCMEYMQQQNHIFVFSTQLANKGAESVLSGQFPTIITYHCTQPATKNFLEDFFIKNPLKVSKSQRQNTLALCNLSSSGNSQQWNSGCNTMHQMTQKHNGNKVNFTGMSRNLDGKAVMRQVNSSTFSELPETLAGNGNDLMCWEQSRSNINGVLNDSNTSLKISSSVGSTSSHMLGGSEVSNKTISASDTCVGNDSGTPSLQGIKVPDENLTPQQRQHREEQLAKLKQIDQFLSNPLQGGNQLNKLGTDGVPGALSNLMLSLSNSGSAGMSSSLNSNVRNLSNGMTHSNQSICNRETVGTGLTEVNIDPSDIRNTHEIENLGCRANKVIQISNHPIMACVPSSAVGGAVAPNSGVGNIHGNTMPCHTGGNNGSDANGGNVGIAESTGIIPSSPEMMDPFLGDGNINTNAAKVVDNGIIHSQEIGQVGMAQIEWSKLQHQFFEERMKKKAQGQTDNASLSASLSRSNTTNIGNAIIRPHTGGLCVSAASSSSSQTIRSSQGPPPPYHPTQRSASVPIATQSPNPVSPNNLTSNRSLPSPRPSGILKIPTNSPNVESLASTISTTLVSTTTLTMSAPISNLNSQGKNVFQSENPTTCGTNNNRIRNNHINQFNNHLSTPASHISPKDLEPFHSNVTSGDMKNARPSPQRARTPLMTTNSSNIAESLNVDGRFPSASPVLNFPQHPQNSNVSPQFCRRIDNLPLNPNSNRVAQKKLNGAFDPISSLAQMSQQLTSCVPLNSSGLGTSDVNVLNNGNPNLEGIASSMDSGVDFCNTGSPGNTAIQTHIGAQGSFISNNCHINSVLGPMGQRILNSKMCGGFNPSNVGVGRDGQVGMHGVLPTHRFMGRMGMNFGNFNVSPNIQVKASTPNTIQYMPVRHQTTNSNNMRVPPSLDFLRYGNSQISGSGNMVDNNHLGQGNTVTPPDPAKINTGQGTGSLGMHFYGNCSQLGSLGGNQDDISAANLLSGHDISMGHHPSIIRGMRPVRHQHIGNTGNHVIPASRMPAPVVPVMDGHFASGSEEAMECGEDSIFIGNASVQASVQNVSSVSSQGNLYSGINNLQKPVKSVGSNNICQGVSTSNTNSNTHSNEHSSSANIAVSNNDSILSNVMQTGNNALSVGCGGSMGNNTADVGYKSFVGPASDDMKYAQQYHSFQQQLYATSTRTQQNTGNNNLGSNISTNQTYFSNK